MAAIRLVILPHQASVSQETFAYKSSVFPIPFVLLRTVTVVCSKWNSKLSRSALNLPILFRLNTLKITKFILKTFRLLNTKTTRRLLFFPVRTVYVINHQSYTTNCISCLLSELSEFIYRSEHIYFESLKQNVDKKLEFVFTAVWRRQLSLKWTV